MKERITVFTPTFNRRDCLKRCYESLMRQTDKRFLWMIIDDGSTDGTGENVEDWKKTDNGFKIEYHYKENGGLHTGYNEAIKYANTELMVCIDSDDYMSDGAIERILKFWDEDGSLEYAGIAGLDIFADGKNVGDLLPSVHNINLIDLLVNKYHIHTGDIKLVVRTDLYKSVAPMPTFNGEKNFNPHYMHLQISENYDFLVLNEPLCVIEYQESGMSNNILKQYYNSPNSFAETRRLYLGFDNVPKLFLFRHSIHYVSSCILAGKKRIVNSAPKKIYALAAYPFGVVLAHYIKRKCM